MKDQLGGILAALMMLCAGAAIAQGNAPPKKAAPESGSFTWSAGPYSYDALGNVINIGTDAYTYDATGRIAGATIKGPEGSQSFSRSYSYDVYGNLLSKTGGGLDVSIGVDPATNHLNAAGTMYDALGDITTLRPPGSPSTYTLTYDSVGMLQSTVLDGGNTQDYYVYTADDERLWTYDVQYSDSNHSTLSYEKSTFTLRDLGGNVLRRFEQTPTTLAWTSARDYYYRDGLLLSSAAGSSGTVEHFTLDHLGTPRLITDSAKNKIGVHVYFPFGEEWFPAQNVVQEAESRKFTGHERDRDLGNDQSPFDYMHARFYGSSLGRFLSVDPAYGQIRSPQSWNSYAYVEDNPLNSIDPTGMWSFSSWARDLFRVNDEITVHAFTLPDYSYGQDLAEWNALDRQLDHWTGVIRHEAQNLTYLRPKDLLNEEVSRHADQAFIDGVIPDWCEKCDPFAYYHYYDVNDPGMRSAQVIGSVTRDVEIAIALKAALKAGVQKGGWLNSNRYLRIGFGRKGGVRVFRIGGKIVEFFNEAGKWDIWTGGKL